MSDQYSLFEFDIESKKLTIEKPIRLIELFAGYGSQALALKYLGVPFEHWHISEWAIKSIQAYKDMHFDDETDYSQGRDYQKILDWLDGRVSQNYNEPLNRAALERYGETYCRQIYSNMICERNVGSIVLAKAKDLEIADTKDYTYILTYSFPCQDLSCAGARAGMIKGSGTRSGMLWEVERILNECDELPQILLMENVPQVITASGFSEWIAFLESIGYTSNYKVLNATDYGVPQNRERCFMVSWQGERWYEFPQPFDLAKSAKDICEETVNESYYIPDERAKELIGTAIIPKAIRERERADVLRECESVWGRDERSGVSDRRAGADADNGMRLPKDFDYAGIYTAASRRFIEMPMKGLSRALKASFHDAGVVIVDSAEYCEVE